MLKLLSVVLSAIITFASSQFAAIPEVIDSAAAALFGVPVSGVSVKEDFLADISDKSVVKSSSTTACCKNLVMIFASEDATFLQKCELFRNKNLALLGWSQPADLYVAFTPFSSPSRLLEFCKELEGTYSAVAVASPVYAEKSSPDYTPDDIFDKAREYPVEWDELNPRGSNWWLEAVQARQAWDYGEYFSTAQVGLVDCGFDFQHEDLDGKLSFPNRIAERYNVPSMHGNHVAGIVGAAHNNGKGIAGIIDDVAIHCVDWEPDDDQVWITELHIFFGIIDLVRSGSKVINLSLGISSNEDLSDFEFELLINIMPRIYSALMSTLLANGHDFIICQSAGNGDSDGNPVDAKYNGKLASMDESNVRSVRLSVSKQDILDRVVVVASAANNGNGKYEQSYFSNVGKYVTIAAPGSFIYSCSLDTSSYTYLSGTSMSTPVVTAICALVWSVNPSFSGADVKKIVCSADNSIADVVPLPEDERAYTDLDYISYQMVNAKLSVEDALMQTHSMGRVEGKAAIDDGVEKVCLIQNGKKTYFTPFSDNSFSFVAPVGEAVIEITDVNGKTITSRITIKKNETLNVNITP